jgi:hypothetical protein
MRETVKRAQVVFESTKELYGVGCASLAFCGASLQVNLEQQPFSAWRISIARHWPSRFFARRFLTAILLSFYSLQRAFHVHPGLPCVSRGLCRSRSHV